MVLFGSIRMRHTKAINAKVVSFLHLLYILNAVIKKLQFWCMVNSLKTCKTSKGVFWFSSARLLKVRGPMVNLALGTMWLNGAYTRNVDAILGEIYVTELLPISCETKPTDIRRNKSYLNFALADFNNTTANWLHPTKLSLCEAFVASFPPTFFPWWLSACSLDSIYRIIAKNDQSKTTFQQKIHL